MIARCARRRAARRLVTPPSACGRALQPGPTRAERRTGAATRRGGNGRRRARDAAGSRPARCACVRAGAPALCEGRRGDLHLAARAARAAARARACWSRTLFARRRPSRYALTFTNLDVLASVVDRPARWRRWMPPALFLLALAAADGRARAPEARTQVTREQATIVLAIDQSGSMLADDIQPTRLQAAQTAVNKFLDRLPPKFRVGMVAFSGDVQVVAPVTRDRELVRNARRVPLAAARHRDRRRRRARREARPQTRSAPPPRAPARRRDVVPPATGTRSRSPCCSSRTASRPPATLTPEDGAAKAKQLGVPVYTIALGTDEGVLNFGVRQIPVPPDRDTLRAIAQQTGGKYFDAVSERGAAGRPTTTSARCSPRSRARRRSRGRSCSLAGILALLAAGASLFAFSRVP